MIISCASPEASSRVTITPSRPSLPFDRVCSRENPRPGRGPLFLERWSLPCPSPPQVRNINLGQDPAEVRMDNNIQCTYLPHAGLQVYMSNKIGVLSRSTNYDYACDHCSLTPSANSRWDIQYDNSIC
jgi:hypothetical protein